MDRKSRRKDILRDPNGFLAKTTPEGAWPTIEFKQMERQLENMLISYQGWEKGVVYAEILEYAKLVIKKFDKVFAIQREIEKAELSKHSNYDGYR
jgi:hypothetical protein